MEQSEDLSFNADKALEVFKATMKPLVFNTLRSFSDMTPESAEHGDWEATGILSEWNLTFRELVEELAGHRKWQCVEGADWLTTGFHTIDYGTGREREETLHVRCYTARHERYYQLALKLAGLKQYEMKL